MLEQLAFQGKPLKWGIVDKNGRLFNDSMCMASGLRAPRVLARGDGDLLEKLVRDAAAQSVHQTGAEGTARPTTEDESVVRKRPCWEPGNEAVPIGAPKTDFDGVLVLLSVRARHILQNLGIGNDVAFLSLTKAQLLKSRNCGKKTVAEITEVQSKLCVPEQSGVFDTRENPVSYETTPPEVFDAIRGNLNVRANNTLTNMGVDNLVAFMRLDEEQLLKQLNCGRKTVRMILGLQRALAAFAQNQSHAEGGFRAEYLIGAPCLAGIVSDTKNLTTAEDFFPDLENPAPWLVLWVNGLARSDRFVRVFMLRMGMLGDAPKTLESIAQEFGVTRERVRQMQVKVEKKAETQYQQFRLRPLAEAAAAVVNEKGGLIGLDELTEVVFGRGKDGDQLKWASPLMAFFCELPVWTNAGLRLRADRTVCNLSRVDEPLNGRAVGRSPAQKRLRFPPLPPAKEKAVVFDPNDLTI